MKFLKLKELCTIKHGYAFKGKYITQQENNNILVTPGNFKVGGGFKEDKCKYYNSKNIPEEYILNENDLIVTMTDLSKEADTLGYSALIPQKDKIYLHNQRIGLIKNINETIINKDYLYWYLRTRMYHNEIVATSTGTTVHHTSPERILNVKIPIYSLSIQNKISKILNIIDNRIRINVQTNDNLYNMCNAIFHNYLNKYSEQIEYTKIVDIVDRVVTGKTPSTKNEEFWNGDIPFITIPDMHNQIFTIDTERTISGVGAKSIIPENSISVSCIATVGLVSISTKKSQTNQQINSIVLKNDYDLYYLFEFLSEQESFMKNIAGGSTTYNINKTTFENIEVPYLPQNIIQEFHNTVCKLFDKIKLNQLENKNLEQLRDTLLPKLMNGEIDLDKIEI